MEKLTEDIIEELKNTSSFDGFIDIVVASRIVGSDQLYQYGSKKLISTGKVPNLDQSKRMGIEAVLAVMMAAMNSLSEENAVQEELHLSEVNQLQLQVKRLESETNIQMQMARRAQAALPQGPMGRLLLTALARGA
jgi:hypothetical protein